MTAMRHTERPMAVAAGKKDYGYCNARLRGMISRQLDADYYDRLIAQADLDGAIRLLSETEYNKDLEHTLLGGHSAANVDLALRTNMAREYQRVLGFVNDEAYRLGRALLGRWDVFNVKTVLRGKHVLASPAEILESVVPAASLTAPELEELAKAPDIRAVVDTMSTWGSPFAAPLNKAMQEYIHTRDLSSVELKLDQWFFARVAERLEGRGRNFELVREIVGIQIDVTNLLTIFRLQRSGATQEEALKHFLKGGTHIDERLFRASIETEDVDLVIKSLRDTPYAASLDGAMMAYVETDSLVVFERALEQYLVRATISARNGDPLGIGVLIAYIYAKHNEITNLRVIIMGHAVAMPERRVRGELILV